MSQHDFVIANQGASAARTDINNGLQALASLNSGTTAPSTTYANMLWYETDTDTLWIRNEANSGWLRLLDIDQSLGAQLIENNVVNTSGTIIGYLGTHSQATWDTGTSTSERLISPDKLEAAIQTHASGGWEIIGTSEPTSDVANITITGLSGQGYKKLKLTFVLQATTNTADPLVEMRASGGSWREVWSATVSSGSNNLVVGGEISFANFADDAATNIMLATAPFSWKDSTSIDRSSGRISLSGQLSAHQSSYTDNYDELRIRFSTGSIEGSNSDDRGFVILEGHK